jgi:hypothetical protein
MLYEALYAANIEDVMPLSVRLTGGAEPLSDYIFWLGANLGIEKDIYISMLNIIFIVSLFLVARRSFVKMPMICLLLTNFYLVVLMTGEERL